jgi:hypothetical protein
MSLANASNAVKRASIDGAKKDLILALVDCVKMIIKGEAPLSKSHLASLKRRSGDIKSLVHPSTSIHQKKEILQRGGFLSALLGPIAGSVLPALLKPILGLFQPRK